MISCKQNERVPYLLKLKYKCRLNCSLIFLQICRLRFVLILHAAHQIRMAKDPQTVSKFLSDLSAKLQPIWLKEKEEMLELKKKEASQVST